MSRTLTLLTLLVFFSSVSSAEPAAKPEVVTNTLGMKLVKIAAGEFTMGSPESEEGHTDVEVQRKVRITRPFYLGQHEVTVGQFRKFVTETGYRTTLEREEKPGFGFDAELGAIEILPKFTWKNTGFGTDEHPVVNLSWDDAQAFCKWLSEKEKQTYQLPTEAQWEYACRAGTKTRYSTGESEESLLGFANLSDAAFQAKYANATWSGEWNDGHAFSAPVGSLKPNAWGLYDMHGNAWEWCSDWYASDYHKVSPVDDPAGPKTGEKHIVRGGAFTNRLRFVRSADRNANKPGYRYNFTGFRVVKVME
ncbi:Serine/threonine-protein kinase pkn1 [Anatilimnocola aggregata]|uniref:Serine/threonine-protein kinase pkn1 n=1 Tax=Anatilimnocola aggregata TaxID=2528021 RepID=A0A517YG18_9BACT|nr:formylglycine-generating enzyme family protein [Anatilimnocola aggregata]QDU29168.1 Serine/threonine-protein kinase pkn1 [Anatilimnocola aggregata]